MKKLRSRLLAWLRREEYVRAAVAEAAKRAYMRMSYRSRTALAKGESAP